MDVDHAKSARNSSNLRTRLLPVSVQIHATAAGLITALCRSISSIDSTSS
jgi:hypothetical protein